jgi:NADPH:quinone reductase-like Zn-dependent oxidoreductase
VKAIIYERYGPPEVLQLRDVATPVPRDNEVRVKVRATTCTIGDTRMRSFTVPRGQWLMARAYLGIRGPKRKILGMELAGDVESIGKSVTRFKVGDAVIASTFAVGFGGYAEYKCFPQDGLVEIKPTNVSYEEAATIVGGGMTALRCLRKAKITRGQKVLVYGASGAVGSIAVQLAKSYGAEVTGVCSTANLELVRSLGADQVIDYTREDFSQGDVRYDVVFDAVHKLSPGQGTQRLTENGIFLDVHNASGSGGEQVNDLQLIRNLVAAGTVRPVVDRCYPLEQVVEAHRYVDLGHKKGNVAITVSPKG